MSATSTYHQPQVSKPLGQQAQIPNEQLTASAFSRQSSVFDAIYTPDKIIQYKRRRVREHIEQFLKPASHILELNAGTGEDATYFASRSHTVHATDISEGMLGKLSAKVAERGLQHAITSEQCSYTELSRLQHKGPYDLIFSNFAGINCTDKLDDVVRSFHPLLKPGGIVTLVVLPPFCLWETMMVFKGKFKTAFRRFNSKNGVSAHVEGVHFKCWYYRPSYIIDALASDYELAGLEGLCTIVPPSYIEGFGDKYPKLFKRMTNAEDRLKTKWPWKYIGDYYIITLKKK